MWVPRFVYNDNEEIGYIKEEATPGEGWIVPDIFMYKTADTTKPDFSLTGVWIQKDVDLTFANKITQMNQEESIYGFIANTKATQTTSSDINEIQKYIVGADASVRPQINDITNLNRIILKIVDNTKHEPIKANVTYNTVDKKIEIRVTYTANGISKILDEYGNAMTLTEKNGIILTDTGSVGLAKGTYYFTVIDNKGNKKELSITPNIDSLFKVAYINGTDNMDNTTAYAKSGETKTQEENTLLNNIKAVMPDTTFNRAISSSGGITALAQITRLSDDTKMYIYKQYNAKEKSYNYYLSEPGYRGAFIFSISKVKKYGYTSYSLNKNTGVATFSGKGNIKTDTANFYASEPFYSSTDVYDSSSSTTTEVYFYEFYEEVASTYNRWKQYSMTINKEITYSQGDSTNKNIVALDGAYESGKRNDDGYWYVKGSLSPKYTLYKYDQNLNLKSIYDVDTKLLTTEPIDISNKGRNKVKLTLDASGMDYKTYISSDKENWQEITITSRIATELNVDGFDNLYIKIETNTSTINNIDVAYYKD